MAISKNNVAINKVIAEPTFNKNRIKEFITLHYSSVPFLILKISYTDSNCYECNIKFSHNKMHNLRTYYTTTHRRIPNIR